MVKSNDNSDLFSRASDKELAAVLKRMVETGDISPEEVNVIRDNLSEEVKSVSQTDVGESEKQLSPEQKEQLLSTLKVRFKANMYRHKRIEWLNVEVRLQEASPEKIWALNEMERTGGKPDVIDYDKETGEYEFWDCSKNSPEGRRNLCYDSAGQEKAEKEESKPEGNAIDMVREMGLGGILNTEQIKKLADLVRGLLRRSSSWVDTPEQQDREEGFVLDADWAGNGCVYVSGGGSRNCNSEKGFHGWLKI